MPDKYGMEIKEMNSVFLISYFVFILIFFGFFYRVCIFPCVPLLSERFFIIIIFGLLSYLGAVTSCAVYVEVKARLKKR